LVDNTSPAPAECNGIPVVPLAKFADSYPDADVTIAVGDPILRERCAEKCAAAGLSFISLVHPRVEISPWVSIGVGTVICAGSIVTTNVSLGEHVHINVDCTVSHDVELGDFTTLSPGVHIAGWVQVGRSVFFGTGAVVRNGNSGRKVRIGDRAVVGAGACVVSDVITDATVAGVPARGLGKSGVRK
jgi:sugar O-acyltransferase (sialic acid O-acetyltransferase NeuD family)